MSIDLKAGVEGKDFQELREKCSCLLVAVELCKFADGDHLVILDQCVQVASCWQLRLQINQELHEALAVRDFLYCFQKIDWMSKLFSEVNVETVG